MQRPLVTCSSNSPHSFCTFFYQFHEQRILLQFLPSWKQKTKNKYFNFTHPPATLPSNTPLKSRRSVSLITLEWCSLLNHIQWVFVPMAPHNWSNVQASTVNFLELIEVFDVVNHSYSNVLFPWLLTHHFLLVFLLPSWLLHSCFYLFLWT